MISLRLFILLIPFLLMACNNDNNNPIVEPIQIPIDSINIVTAPKNIRYLALGDSYTIGQDVDVDKRFPVQLVGSLRRRGYQCYNANIIAQTGWRTDNLMTGIANENLTDTFSLVSLLIGVNNQYQGRPQNIYRAEFRTLLQQAIGFAGGDKNKVFVLSIPDYGVTPFAGFNGPQISQQIDEFNAINLEVTDSFNIEYFNITPISRLAENGPALLANDQLHPSGKMYRMWVELILDDVESKID